MWLTVNSSFRFTGYQQLFTLGCFFPLRVSLITRRNIKTFIKSHFCAGAAGTPLTVWRPVVMQNCNIICCLLSHTGDFASFYFLLLFTDMSFLGRSTIMKQVVKYNKYGIKIRVKNFIAWENWGAALWVINYVNNSFHDWTEWRRSQRLYFIEFSMTDIRLNESELQERIPFSCFKSCWQPKRNALNTV